MARQRPLLECSGQLRRRQSSRVVPLPFRSPRPAVPAQLHPPSACASAPPPGIRSRPRRPTIPSPRRRPFGTTVRREARRGTGVHSRCSCGDAPAPGVGATQGSERSSFSPLLSAPPKGLTGEDGCCAKRHKSFTASRSQSTITSLFYKKLY
jgi:hypothetical protein